MGQYVVSSAKNLIGSSDGALTHRAEMDRSDGYAVLMRLDNSLLCVY